MSYEGYDQHICHNGHRFDEDCYSDHPTCHCGAKSFWSNSVDQTNGDEVGFIKESEFQKLLISEQKVQKCNLGHNHITHGAIYRFPKEGELQRFMRNDKGSLVKLRNHTRSCRNWDSCKCPLETARV